MPSADIQWNSNSEDDVLTPLTQASRSAAWGISSVWSFQALWTGSSRNSLEEGYRKSDSLLGATYFDGYVPLSIWLTPVCTTTPRAWKDLGGVSVAVWRGGRERADDFRVQVSPGVSMTCSTRLTSAASARPTYCYSGSGTVRRDTGDGVTKAMCGNDESGSLRSVWSRSCPRTTQLTLQPRHLQRST